MAAMADAAVWKKRVSAWRASGLTAAVFCDEQGLVLSSLRYWTQRVRRDDEAAAPPPVRLAQVVRQAEPPLADVAALVVEVGGARISVARGFDRATLAAVIDVLGASGAR
jgi:hypothetical protein